MATGTIGSAPTTNFWAWDASMHQAWIGSYSVGAITRFIQVNAIFAAFSGGGAGGPVGWQNTTSAPIFTSQSPIGAGNQSTGGGGANRASTGDIASAAGDNWQFGFYCANGVFPIYRTGGTDSFVKASAISAANSGTSFTTDFGTGGSQYAYGTYFIMEIYVRRSSAWVKTFVYVRRSSAWANPDVYIRRGGGWTQVGQLIQRNELDDKRELEAMLVWPDGRWEPALARWDYDRPRYAGVGYPGEKEGDWVRTPGGVFVPGERFYRTGTPQPFEIAA